MNEDEEAAIADRVIDDALANLDTCLEEVPDSQMSRFVLKVQEWAGDQMTD